MAKLEDKIRKKRNALGDEAVPDMLQGVTKDRIREVLARIDQDSDDAVDCVFALLDGRPSWYRRPREGMIFSEGATTAHIGCHVGILQRGASKADREVVRDYWIKPLRELGAIEAVSYISQRQEFAAGHPVSKSGNSGYRLSDDFVAILRAPKKKWGRLLDVWAETDRVRRRAELQAQLAADSRASADTKHSDLIRKVVQYYAPNFLLNYEIVYIDDGDGDRVTESERARLATAGLEIDLGDAMPDVLLWNREDDSLWVVEAVTSDGEVDLTKVKSVLDFARRNEKSNVRFSTAYPSWKVAAQRQGRHKNIAPETFIWIAEDPSKHFYAETYG